MISKWIVTTGLLASVACSAPPPQEPAPENQPADEAADAASEPVELLFVQNAQGVEYADGVMKLTGVNPTTLYFSDRPHRIAGHVTLESFLHTMAELETFKDSPPNAVLVTLEDHTIQDVVLVMTARPTLEGDTLSFPVRILDGEPPASASSISLFIDSAGQPDVWQTPGTAPRDAAQPGTMARNYDQPKTASRNYDQPGTAARGAKQPGEIEDGDYKQPGTYGRYDIRGPSDSRGRKQE
jgi:hypothetical protein